MLASNESMRVDVNHKKKYTWKINFGYSSNTSGNTISNFNYLSVVDYAMVVQLLKFIPGEIISTILTAIVC